MMAELGSQLKSLGLAFWSPAEAIDRVVAHSRPGLLQSILVVVHGMLLVVAYPLTVRISASLSSAGVSEDDFDQFRHNLHTTVVIAIAAIFLALFISWYVTAGLLHLLNIFLSSREVPYAQLLSLSVLASVYGIAGQLNLLLILSLGEPNTFNSLQNTQVPMGLNLIPVSLSPFLRNFLGHINPYEALTTLLLAYGFTRITKASSGAAYACIFSFWLAWSAVRSLRYLIF